MSKFLSFIGYSTELESKDKFTYIINAVSLGFVFLYLIFYIVFVKSWLINSVTIFTFIVLSFVFILLKYKRYHLAKLLLIFGFFFQEFCIVFFWFPRDTDLIYFIFIVAPISFFIYDFEIKRERVAIIVVNILAAIMMIFSKVTPEASTVIEVSETMTFILSNMSGIFTIGSIFIVYYFYANSLSKVYKELKYLANTDSLTSIPNRRILFHEGDLLIELNKKYHRAFAFLLFDIDFFKKINDQYGHPAGDEILIQLTELISSNIRQNDIFSRYGGEEFAIILKNVSADRSAEVADFIRKLVKEFTFTTPEGEDIQLTISIGVVNFDNKLSNFSEMVSKADTALYEAKQTGRNKVIVAK